MYFFTLLEIMQSFYWHFEYFWKNCESYKGQQNSDCWGSLINLITIIESWCFHYFGKQSLKSEVICVQKFQKLSSKNYKYRNCCLISEPPSRSCMTVWWSVVSNPKGQGTQGLEFKWNINRNLNYLGLKTVLNCKLFKSTMINQFYNFDQNVKRLKS